MEEQKVKTLKEIVKEANDRVRNHEVVFKTVKESDDYYRSYYEQLIGDKVRFKDFQYCCLADLRHNITVEQPEEEPIDRNSIFNKY